MSLTDNIFALKKRWPAVWERLTLTDEQNKTKQFHVIESKKGLPTVKISVDGNEQFLHSKYDPVVEAKRIIDGVLDDLNDSDHILFYGIGMGYHIEQLIESRPNQSFTLYEPFAEMFQHYLSYGNFSRVSNHVNQLFVEIHPNDASSYINQFLQAIQSKVKLVILPSYERLFADKVNLFTEQFKNVLHLKTSQLRTDSSFEKLWTLNSMRNFKHVLKTPNIIHQCKEHFENKPVVLVSAGPSLDDEIENLRTIKEKGLAYIFSVGSAINKLIQHSILPDAACTYDPTPLNAVVFEKLVQQNISDIPLIFGSSVGFSTITNYPGPMFHMLTGQDTISGHLLRLPTKEQVKRVNDAPSIAIITLQLLGFLECSQVILVGQNLAFRGEQFYADGIDYQHRDSKLNSKDKEDAFLVQDVYGNKVLTNSSLNRMRLNLENVIAANPSLKVVNTTKGGASIAGTTFEELDTIINKELTSPIVSKQWMSISDRVYDSSYLNMKLSSLDQHYQLLHSQLRSTINHLKTIQKFVDLKKENELISYFPRFDKQFKNLNNNEFHRSIIRPMNRVQYEFLMKNIIPIRMEKNNIRKGQLLVDTFSKYIICVKQDIERFSAEYELMKKDVLTYLSEKSHVNNM